MSLYKVKFTFSQPILGTAPMNKEIYTEFIAGKAPADTVVSDEIDSTPVDPEKGKTGFHRGADGGAILYDYVIKGFAKDACSMLRYDSSTLSKKFTAHKRKIDGLFFVTPRQIPISGYDKIETLERPLRAQTAQGERIALAASEMIQAGAQIEFTLRILADDTIGEDIIREWFDYGQYRGLGQWRNASWGSFTYEMSRA